MLLTAKSFETFPKHSGYGFMALWFFALNWYIFVAFTKKNCCLHYDVDFMYKNFDIILKNQ